MGKPNFSDGDSEVSLRPEGRHAFENEILGDRTLMPQRNILNLHGGAQWM